jgi:hypothetical protein
LVKSLAFFIGIGLVLKSFESDGFLGLLGGNFYQLIFYLLRAVLDKDELSLAELARIFSIKCFWLYKSLSISLAWAFITVMNCLMIS